jgi:hypothetical protein
MIIVIPDMPTELKEKAMRYLTAAYPDNLVETDTWSAKHQHTFESVHFSWYNRYSKRVCFLSYFLYLHILISWIGR